MIGLNWTLVVLLCQLREAISAINGNAAEKVHQSLLSTPIPIFKNTLPNLPKIADGHKQFQFFNLDPEGKLIKQWMSLQEVQNIILAYALTRQSEKERMSLKGLGFNAHLSSKFRGPFDPHLAWKKSTQPKPASVEDVLANVQKVMSKEMSISFLRDDMRTPSFTETEAATTRYDGEDHHVTMPDQILAKLMKDQVASLETHRPWGIMTQAPHTGLFDGLFFTAVEETSLTTPQPKLDVKDFDEENFLIEENVEATTLKITASTDDTAKPSNDEKKNVRNNAKYSKHGDMAEITTVQIETTTPLELNMDDEIDNYDLFTAQPILSTIIVVPTEDTTVQTDQKALGLMEDDTTIEATTLQTTNLPNGDTTESIPATRLNNDINYTITPVSLTLTKDATAIPLNEQDSNYTTITQTLNISDEETTMEPITPTTTNLYRYESSTLPGLSYTITPVESLDETTELIEEKTFDSKTTLSPEYNFRNEPLDDDENTHDESDTSSLHITNEQMDTAKYNTLHTKNKIIHSKLESFSMDYINSKSSGNIISNSEPSPVATSVLTPLEMAKVPLENMVDLGKLQGSNDYAEYGYDDSPIYLEDLSVLDYVDYEDLTRPVSDEGGSESHKLDFPSPESTNSYHKPEHVINSEDEALKEVDPTQFLPSHNPDIAKGENPLEKTPVGNLGLEETVADLDPEIRKYVEAMNEVAFKVYKGALKIHRRQNLVMSPLNLISSLSMLLLGARGKTADALSEVLRTDQFRMFNPHLVLRNVTQSMLNLNNVGHETAFVNNIFIKKPAMKPYNLDFFSRTMDTFYDSLVKQVPTNALGTIARDVANDKVRHQTSGTVQNFLKPNASLKVYGPLTVVSSAYFQGDWIEDIDKTHLFDMNFIRFPSAERRLIRTVGIEKEMSINAGYSEELDATVAEIPLKSSSVPREISLLLVMPGQQKSFVANGLAQLENSLTSERWNKLLRSLIPHNLNFKMPIFSHRNYLNLSGILPQIGLDQLFEDSSDFSGINGAKDLHLGDLVQLSEFHSCKLELKMFGADPTSLEGEDKKKKNPRLMEEEEEGKGREDKEGGIRRKKDTKERVRKGREEERKASYKSDKTLAYDRAFFYVLRHNPTGLILFIGRYLDPETF